MANALRIPSAPAPEAVHCYVSEAENALYVRDEFDDAAALGFHLSTTAGPHFPQLLAVANPGPFFFGNVPVELQKGTEQMQLGAEFGTPPLVSAGKFDEPPRGQRRYTAMNPCLPSDHARIRREPRKA